MDKYFVEQQITNHKLFTDVERYVRITKFTADAEMEYIKLEYKIRYVKDEEDITHQFNKALPVWIVTNSTKVSVRDSEGNKIPNPNYNPEEEGSEEFVMAFAYDYFRSISFDAPNPVKLKSLMSSYITLNDLETNLFDI